MIPISKPIIGQEEIDAVTEVMLTGMLAQGKKVLEFENQFAEKFNYGSAAAISNGTVALHVALKAAGVQANDKVLTTAFTFVATSNAILYCDALPIYVDVDEGTYNISPNALRQALKEHSDAKYLLLVHLFGQSCDMKQIIEIAKEYNLIVIEDCAQAHAALYQQQNVGSFGLCGTFSFYPTKNMSTGEGGMIVSNNIDFINRCKLLINHGSKQRYVHEVLGYNYRMSNISAAIGIEQLKKLDQMNEKRKSNAKYYLEHINNPAIIAPLIDERAEHVFHQFTIRTSKRDEFIEYLNHNGIESGIYYPIPLHKQQHIIEYMKKHKLTETVLAVTNQLAKEVVSLPIHPQLSQQEIEYIVSVINKFSV